MTLAKALTELRKVLGKKAGIRDNKIQSSPELRNAANAAIGVAVTQKNAAEAAMRARRDEILANDEEYQRLLCAYEDAQQKRRKCNGPSYRYTAGIVGDLFFYVKAEADTLAELLEKVKR
jgi:hypothetical protein